MKGGLLWASAPCKVGFDRRKKPRREAWLLSVSKNFRSFRTIPQDGVGIPRLEGKCSKNAT